MQREHITEQLTVTQLVEELTRASLTETDVVLTYSHRPPQDQLNSLSTVWVDER